MKLKLLLSLMLVSTNGFAVAGAKIEIENGCSWRESPFLALWMLPFDFKDTKTGKSSVKGYRIIKCDSTDCMTIMPIDNPWVIKAEDGGMIRQLTDPRRTPVNELISKTKSRIVFKQEGDVLYELDKDRARISYEFDGKSYEAVTNCK